MTHGIPTTYNGINFRSRLEARWAAFFDALGWPYEYEPYDLAGYIPDFLLKTKRPILVEIKNPHEIGEPVRAEMLRAKPSDVYAMALFGESPYWGHECIATLQFGTRFDDGKPHGWHPWQIFRTQGLPQFDFAPGPAPYEGAFTGAVSDFSAADLAVDHYCGREVTTAWKQACNAVQWHPKRRRT